MLHAQPPTTPRAHTVPRLAATRRGARPPAGVCAFLFTIACALITCAAAPAPADPIQLHPDNPHYFLFRGKPTIIITSGEHYGAVLNRDFDYKKYLPVLASHGFNYTRMFSGNYCENPGAFKIKHNTLGPAGGRLLCPWARSGEPGYAGGGNKFDLTKWDDAYFARFRDFLAEADKHGIVVECSLFCPFYGDEMWNVSPIKATNNVNNVGHVPRKEALSLKEKALTDMQLAMVRKIVTELNGFDNLTYEICNEPYFGASDDFQALVAKTIVETEARLPKKHLIAQNIANKQKKIDKPDPNVSIFNFHYAAPPNTVAMNYGLDRVIGDDETGFRGTGPQPYRLEAWDFVIAGGGLFNNLDYSFQVGHEQGDGDIDAPGGGGPVYRKQIEILRGFINAFDFIHMKPDNGVIKAVTGDKASARALVQAGRAYAIYVNGGGVTELTVDLPAGKYRAEWVSTKTGEVETQTTFDHAGGQHAIKAPKYEDDIALRIVRQK
jgi:hypothetical protein